MNEKKKPTYDLTSIKVEFSTVAKLRMTRTAQNDAQAFGYMLQDVVDLIQTITRAQFYKSMTSLKNHQIWQDVYHVPAGSLVLYVKFTVDDEGKLLISFKEK